MEACARSALGPYWLKATALQRQEFVGLYEDYAVMGYSTALRAPLAGTIEDYYSVAELDATKHKGRSKIK